MAFLKTARAVVVHPHINPQTWAGLRKTASIAPAQSVSTQAQEILGGPLDPSRYLVTHCTIVASVDTKPVPGVKTGTIRVGSKTIDRRWPDYLITPETEQYINGNRDAFPRNVLLKSYRTFIGAQNFLEHVQIESQSKGRVIDAVARDIGDSVYVDILVATDRKHEDLVRQIEDGTLSTLSMGCTCDATQCTKCGHVAADETQLCDCVKYEKGNIFIDDQGNRRMVAELCGHPSMGDTGGVRFIEASWVAVPAFRGAVMRNVLSPIETIGKKAQEILSSPPPQWVGTGVIKAASAHLAFDMGSEDDSGGGEAPSGGAEPKDPMAEAEEKLYTALRERVVKRIEKDLSKKDEGPSQALPPAEGGSASTNENLTKMGGVKKLAYTQAVDQLVCASGSNADFISNLATVNSLYGVRLGSSVYWAAYQVGPAKNYKTPSDFLAACHAKAGRKLSNAEVRAIIRIGSLLARRARLNTGE